MRRVDLISLEAFLSETYRREAVNRRSKNPALAAQLQAWGDASARRVEALKTGPLFAEDK